MDVKRAMAKPLLKATEVSKDFGGLRAVHALSFEVRSNQIKGVIGPNGAGKTTIFNLITGVLPLSEGMIEFQGQLVSNLKPYQISKIGISRTFQNVRLFHGMTVIENVMVGRHCRTSSSIISAGFRLLRMRNEEKSILEKSLELLSFVGLEEEAQKMSSKLPIGQQKMLEIGRALATEPSLLILDEPAAGLNSDETNALKVLIKRIKDNGTTVLLIEHDMDLVMGICDEIMVLNFGQKIAEGTSSEIKRSENVINAYLGEEADA